MKILQKLNKRVRLKIVATKDRLFSHWRYETQKKKWNQQWASPTFQPSWEIKEIPSELQEAIDIGWFPPRASILDIGCGTGNMSALLAEKGFTVTGVDYSPSAISRAKKKHGEVDGKLQFKTIDICNQSDEKLKFNVLVDRGCFHVIPHNFASKYTKAVAEYSEPGTRFLLWFIVPFVLNKGDKQNLGHQGNREQTVNYIESSLSPYFQIHKVEDTRIENEQGSLPAVAVWMTRY